jgi:hypothetical protein
MNCKVEMCNNFDQLYCCSFCFEIFCTIHAVPIDKSSEMGHFCNSLVQVECPLCEMPVNCGNGDPNMIVSEHINSDCRANITTCMFPDCSLQVLKTESCLVCNNHFCHNHLKHQCQRIKRKQSMLEMERKWLQKLHQGQ